MPTSSFPVSQLRKSTTVAASSGVAIGFRLTLYQMKSIPSCCQRFAHTGIQNYETAVQTEPGIKISKIHNWTETRSRCGAWLGLLKLLARQWEPPTVQHSRRQSSGDVTLHSPYQVNVGSPPLFLNQTRWLCLVVITVNVFYRTNDLRWKVPSLFDENEINGKLNRFACSSREPQF
jgi:hypothetical protein